MAQEGRVATLQHGTNIRAYYGPDALVEAHNGAVDGDVITLSSGEFNCGKITKAITIRGEGMTNTTIIPNYEDMITLPKGSSLALTFEGLSCRYSAPVSGRSFNIKGTDGTEKIVISKCFFNLSSGTGRLFFEKCQGNVIQSKIDCRIYAYTGANVVCINCVLNNIWCDNSSSANDGTFDVQNCFIFNSSTGINSIYNSSIKNSIICPVLTLDNTNKTSHCLVKDGSSGFADSWYVKTTYEPGPWDEDPAPVLWGELFSGTYRLTEDAAATYLGTDGTQVGIYGGMYPYDTTPDYPLVKRLDVIGSHNDGKLNVKINVE